MPKRQISGKEDPGQHEQGIVLGGRRARGGLAPAPVDHDPDEYDRQRQEDSVKSGGDRPEFAQPDKYGRQGDGGRTGEQRGQRPAVMRGPWI